jgi:hypothetical protein
VGDDKGTGLLTERCQQPRPHGTPDEKKAEEDYDTRSGYRIPGSTFSDVSATMFTFNNNTAKIYVRWIAPGKIEYFFKIKCGEKAFEEISVKDISTELIPIFNKAEQVDSATEIAIAFVAFMSAIASPVPGDEAAAGAALSRLLTVAGVI